ncbi:MAG TPA: DUF2911 domain-containing protein [Gemmatimonadales bacterium]|nr:DUF2911 domain-containing protein [Gemmatimonadales bacterium]
MRRYPVGLLAFSSSVLLGTAGNRAVTAQEALFVHRLGRDTVAVEQYTRSGNRMTGEVASRLGPTGTRLEYEVALAADGRPVTARYRARTLAGAPIPNQPSEVRITFVGDSVKREAVFPESTSVRTLPAAGGVPFQPPAYGLMEVAFARLRRSGGTSATVAAVGTGAGNPARLQLTAGAGDTIRSANTLGVATVYRVDRDGKILSVDGTGTTQKFVSTRDRGPVDLTQLAARMTPLGTLSARGLAHGSFLQSVVFVNYGRPQVRGRPVWGGVLVPPDTIWRLGANEATHLATSRELTFGDVVVPPGLYTLWIFSASSGPQLVINRQVGQWGTSYDPARDLGRVPLQMAPAPEHVEDFTITVRNLGGNRGALDFAWGDRVATAAFTVRPS